MDVDQEEQEEPHSWVEQEEPYSCGACGKRVTSNRINRARWYAYNHPSGWREYGQICGPCLRFSWRSMTRSWDENIHDDADCNHAEWKKKLFTKVIQKRLWSPPTGVIDPHDPRNEPDNYVLGPQVGPQESDE